MLLYVNATEYLPTTEAVGVRLTIHDKEDFPFPDTFGYSAPTGYVSSFGMKMVPACIVYFLLFHPLSEANVEIASAVR